MFKLKEFRWGTKTKNKGKKSYAEWSEAGKFLNLNYEKATY